MTGMTGQEHPGAAGSKTGASSRAAGSAPRRRGLLGTAVAAAVLVLALAGWGWFATEQARAGWWTFGAHIAVGPDSQGWAGTDTLSLRLAAVETVAEVDEEQPPAGFTYLTLELEVDAATPTELTRCEVQVLDQQGRLFLAGQEVPGADPYVSSLTCGSSDPEDPVEARQSMLVLVPSDAELVSVRVGALEFPPARFIELPLPS